MKPSLDSTPLSLSASNAKCTADGSLRLKQDRDTRRRTDSASLAVTVRVSSDDVDAGNVNTPSSWSAELVRRRGGTGGGCTAAEDGVGRLHNTTINKSKVHNK